MNNGTMPDALINAFSDSLSDAVLDLPEQERYKKARQAFLDALWDEIQYSIIDRMAEHVKWFVRDMAEKTVKEMLEGRDEQIRRYLNLDGYTGRDRKHEVIHGTLFETGAIALRKKIAQEHADLIRSERIKDLEDQLQSLVAQVNERDSKIAKLQDTIRERKDDHRR